MVHRHIPTDLDHPLVVAVQSLYDREKAVGRYDARWEMVRTGCFTTTMLKDWGEVRERARVLLRRFQGEGKVDAGLEVGGDGLELVVRLYLVFDPYEKSPLPLVSD